MSGNPLHGEEASAKQSQDRRGAVSCSAHQRKDLSSGTVKGQTTRTLPYDKNFQRSICCDFWPLPAQETLIPCNRYLQQGKSIGLQKYARNPIPAERCGPPMQKTRDFHVVKITERKQRTLKAEILINSDQNLSPFSNTIFSCLGTLHDVNLAERA